MGWSRADNNLDEYGFENVFNRIIYPDFGEVVTLGENIRNKFMFINQY